VIAVGTGVRRPFHLALPYDTWAGRKERAGLLYGYGPITPDQARLLAQRASSWVATRNPRGRIILHAQITDLTRTRTQQAAITAAVRGIDTDSPPEPGYRPSRALAAQVRARDGTCRHPACNRSAWAGDLDHTVPYDRGGPTAAGNLSALDRRHHRIKSLPGVRLDQPRPGTLIWTTRTGDIYLVTPEEFLLGGL
jgi:hypothetical protein